MTTTYDTTHHTSGQHDRSLDFFVFGFLLACYLITYTGVIQSSDGLAMYATAESIVRRGELDSNQLLWLGNQQGNLGPDGDLYSRKGLGMTLLAVPLIWFARIWPVLGLVQTALLLNPILTAWTGALVFRTGRRLGWSSHTSVFAALIYGLATLAWPYTQTFFSDPVCAFGLFVAFFGLLAFGQTGRKRYLLAGGSAWAIAYLARVANLVTLPIFLVGLAIVILNQAHNAPAQTISPSTADDNTASRRLWLLFSENWRPWVSYLIPIVLAGLLSLWWNWVRYGNIWNSGYVETERFNATWWFGAWGLLVSPGRGLLWYSPVLFLAFAGIRWFWRQARLVLLLTAAISAAYLLLYGKWYMWHGGYSWGPRFLVPLLPFLALLTGPSWNAMVRRQRWGAVGRALVLLLVLISILIQWLGMLVPFRLVQEYLATAVEPLFAPITFTQLAYSPLYLQWRFLTDPNIHLAWLPGGGNLQGIDWFALFMPLSGVAVGILVLVRQLQARHSLIWPASTRHWLYGSALCIIALAMLTHVYLSVDTPMIRLARRIEQLESTDNAILHLRPEAIQKFLNAYHGRQPIYGLVPQFSLDAESEQWLARLEQTYLRLWLIPEQPLPEQSGWERTLRNQDFLLLETRLSEPTGHRLALYSPAAANATQLQEAGIGTTFGDPALIETGITDANGWMRLEGYALTPNAHPGGALLLVLRWRSLQPINYNYQIFVHLLNDNDEKLAQRDGQPVQWMRPTSTWQTGEEITDRYGLLLSNDLPTGDYSIAIGVYDPISGQRLPVSAGPRDYAIELGPIAITPGG